MTNKALMQKTE